MDPEEQQEEEKDDGDGGDEGAGKKKRKFTKELRTGIYTPCNSEYRCYKVNIKDPRYNIKRGAPTSFVPDSYECHCGKKCEDDPELAFISQRTILQTVSGLAISVNMRLSPKTIFGSMSEPNTTTSICISVSSKIAKRVHKVGNMEMMNLLLYGPT